MAKIAQIVNDGIVNFTINYSRYTNHDVAPLNSSYFGENPWCLCFIDLSIKIHFNLFIQININNRLTNRCWIKELMIWHVNNARQSWLTV